MKVEVKGKEVPKCVLCGEAVSHHRVRMAWNDQTGRRNRYGGEYYSCSCGALTLGFSGYNQRLEERV